MDQGAELDGLSFHGGAGVVSHITAVLIICWIAMVLCKAWGGYDATDAKVWLGYVVCCVVM